MGFSGPFFTYLYYPIIISLAYLLFDKYPLSQLIILLCITSFFIFLTNVVGISPITPEVYPAKKYVDLILISVSQLYLLRLVFNYFRNKNYSNISQENLFKSILVNSGDYLAIIDSDYRIKYYNNKFKLLFKKITNVDIYIGIKWTEVKFDYSLLQAWRLGFDKAMQGEYFTRDFSDFIEKYPVFKDLDFTFNPIMNDQGDIIATTVMGINTSDKLRKERDLIINEQRLSSVISSAQEGIWDWDLLSGKFYISDEWKKMLGYNGIELENKIDTLKRLIHPDDLEPVFKLINAHLRGDTDFYQAEYRMLQKNGQYKWVHSRGKIIEYYQDQTPSRFIGVHIDENEKLTKTIAINNLKIFYENVLNNVPVGLTVLNNEFKVIFANKSAFPSESTRNKIIGLHIFDVVNNELPRQAALAENRIDIFNNYVLKNKSHEWEEKLFSHNRNKDFYFLQFSIPIVQPSTDERHTILLSVNITDLKEALAQLESANERTLQALQVKQHFVNVISHEIRTPLNSIIGFSKLLLTENPKQEQINNLKLLNNSADMLLKLVNDILDFSKLESGKSITILEPCNIKEVVTASTLLFKEDIHNKKLHFIQNIDDAIPESVLCDGIRVSQILNNLIHNAIKFTPEGGDISVEVKLQNLEQNIARIYFSVTDNGIGISLDQQQNIFDLFTQATPEIHRKFGGTGLGLAIIKKIIESMHASLYLESDLGKGAKFYFTLELEVTNREIEKQKNENLNIADKYALLKNKSILIVDDNNVNIILFQNFLRHIRMSYESVYNGAEALEKMKLKKYDIVLMDLQMPVMDGFETSKYIRNWAGNPNQNIPIICVTADVNESIKGKIKLLGINNLLSKPFKSEHLYDMLLSHIP